MKKAKLYFNPNEEPELIACKITGGDGDPYTARSADGAHFVHFPASVDIGEAIEEYNKANGPKE